MDYLEAVKNAANFILTYPEEVIRFSVKELSEKNGSSQAAIIRLCKSGGVSGFQDLKVRIAGDLQTNELYNYRHKEIASDEEVSS